MIATTPDALIAELERGIADLRGLAASPMLHEELRRKVQDARLSMQGAIAWIREAAKERQPIMDDF